MPGEIPTDDREGQHNAAGNPFKLGDFSIDEYEPIKVVCIGAGFSGITAGIRCVSLDTLTRKHGLTRRAKIPAAYTQCTADDLRQERRCRWNMVHQQVPVRHISLSYSERTHSLRISHAAAWHAIYPRTAYVCHLLRCPPSFTVPPQVPTHIRAQGARPMCRI